MYVFFQLKKTPQKVIYYKVFKVGSGSVFYKNAGSGSGSILRKSAGSGSAKNECGSTALPVVFLKIETYRWPFLWLSALHLRINCISCRRSWNISVDLSLFVSLYNANFMNKLKFNIFFYLKWNIIHWLDTPLSTQRKDWSS